MATRTCFLVAGATRWSSSRGQWGVTALFTSRLSSWVDGCFRKVFRMNGFDLQKDEAKLLWAPPRHAQVFVMPKLKADLPNRIHTSQQQVFFNRKNWKLIACWICFASMVLILVCDCRGIFRMGFIWSATFMLCQCMLRFIGLSSSKCLWPSFLWLILACQPLFASLLWQKLGFLSGSKHDAKKDSIIIDFSEKLNIFQRFSSVAKLFQLFQGRMANISNLDQAISTNTTDLKGVRAVYDLNLQAMNGSSTSKRLWNFWQKDDDLTAECEIHFLPGTDVFFPLL